MTKSIAEVGYAFIVTCLIKSKHFYITSIYVCFEENVHKILNHVYSVDFIVKRSSILCAKGC